MEETLRAADMACYMAKEKGRNRVQVYHPSDAELVERVGEMAWVQRIRNGLDEERFCLFAQEIRSLKARMSPIVPVSSCCSGCTTKTASWSSRAASCRPAERYGLMPLIDRWVVRNAFAMLADRLNSAGTDAVIKLRDQSLRSDFRRR